jgi:hypothetical protein
MLSRIHLTDADGVVWLFPTSCAAKTLVGVIHLTQLSRPSPSGGHALAAVLALVVWSLAAKLNGLASAVAILFPCGGRRVLEVAGVAGDACVCLATGPKPPRGKPPHQPEVLPVQGHNEKWRREGTMCARAQDSPRRARLRARDAVPATYPGSSRNGGLNP